MLIAVSSVHHRAIVEAAAAAGCDILCEKPLALDLAETDAILAAVERAGVRLQVGLMRRHDPDHVRARARIVAGELGRPLIFTSRQFDTDPPPAAILDPAVSGGIMLDMGIHEFDSARFLMGSEVVDVQATGSVQVYPEAVAHGDVDTAVVNLRFASGAIGSVELSRRIAFGEDVRTEVHGTDGSAFIGGLPIEHGSALRSRGRDPVGRRRGRRRRGSPPPIRTRRAPSPARSRPTPRSARPGSTAGRRSSSPWPPSAPSSTAGAIAVDAEA